MQLMPMVLASPGAIFLPMLSPNSFSHSRPTLNSAPVMGASTLSPEQSEKYRIYGDTGCFFGIGRTEEGLLRVDKNLTAGEDAS